MENKYYSLGSVENSRFIKLIQIVFGILCIAVAIFWFLFNLRAAKTDKTLWITIIFLAGFGFYMVWAGLGLASRFIEVQSDKIRLKTTILLSPVELAVQDIQKILIFPFNLTFMLTSGRKINMRLSSSYYETNAMIKDSILDFAEENKVSFEMKEEKI